jgi:hypothetical protein
MKPSETFGVYVQLKRGQSDLLIPRKLSAKRLRTLNGGLLNLKDLLRMFPERATAPSGGYPKIQKLDAADLLIRRGLLAKLRETAGEDLLNLKGLLTASPPSGGRNFRGLSGFVVLLKLSGGRFD